MNPVVYKEGSILGALLFFFIYVTWAPKAIDIFKGWMKDF